MSGLYLPSSQFDGGRERKAAEKKTGGAWDRGRRSTPIGRSGTTWSASSPSGSKRPTRIRSRNAGRRGCWCTNAPRPTPGSSTAAIPPVQGYLADAFWGGDRAGTWAASNNMPGWPPPMREAAPCRPSSGPSPGAPQGSLLQQCPRRTCRRGRTSGAVGPYRDPSNGPNSRAIPTITVRIGIFWRYAMPCCPSTGNLGLRRVAARRSCHGDEIRDEHQRMGERPLLTVQHSRRRDRRGALSDVAPPRIACPRWIPHRPGFSARAVRAPGSPPPSGLRELDRALRSTLRQALRPRPRAPAPHGARR